MLNSYVALEQIECYVVAWRVCCHYMIINVLPVGILLSLGRVLTLILRLAALNAREIRDANFVPVIYKGSGFYTTDYKKSSVDATAEDGKSSKQDQKESKDKKNGKKESSAGSGSSSDKNKESTSQESVDSSSTKPKGD